MCGVTTGHVFIIEQGPFKIKRLHHATPPCPNGQTEARLSFCSDGATGEVQGEECRAVLVPLHKLPTCGKVHAGRNPWWVSQNCTFTKEG